MVKFFAGATLAAGLLAGSALSASAATHTYAPGTPNGLDNNSNFGDKVSGTTANPFIDYFTFTVPTGGEYVGASISSKNAALNVTEFAIYLGSGSLTAFTPVSVAVPGSATKVLKNTSGFAPIDPNAYAFLSAGLYAIKVSGTGSNSNFSGTLNVSAVPLPTSVALFGTAVMGLGVAGAMRRKKTGVSAVSAA